MVPRGPHLYSTLGLLLDVFDLVPALTHHVLDLVCWQLQLQVRLFFAVAVWRQQLVQLGYCRLLAVLQRKRKVASVSDKIAGLLRFWLGLQMSAVITANGRDDCGEKQREGKCNAACMCLIVA